LAEVTPLRREAEQSRAEQSRAEQSRAEKEQDMPLSILPIVVSTQLFVAVADRIPSFDIARSCKLDVAATSGLSVDQSVKSCVKDENTARQQLAGQWSKFSASMKAQCIPLESVGGTPSYVSLLTCLQMNLWSR
jgi:hypothetical protein